MRFNPLFKWTSFAAALAATYLFNARTASGAEPTREQADQFEKKVRPILAEHCFGCHSETAQSANKNKGNLFVDSLAGLLKGGSHGPALVAGHPEKSRLIEGVGYRNPDFKMPPNGKLSNDEIEILAVWIKNGAKWPDSQIKNGLRASSRLTEDDRRWWAFQPICEPAVPPLRNPQSVVRNPIDNFILAKLAVARLTPAEEASRPVLIRRLTFDLIGLPPTPEEIDAFVADKSDDAYAKLVDRLLASPRYGERWAQHWLDLVRYADSDGYKADGYRPNAWRYRDYVVQAFNNDKPYDRFVREQLAGDELYPDNPDALIATGYLRHWIYEYNNPDVRLQWSGILNDITDTTADVFLGLGLQCARCHDHKYDPLLQKDYFRLQAFFANVLPYDNRVVASAEEQAEYSAKMKVWEEKTASIRREIAAIEEPYRQRIAEGAMKKFPDETQAMIRKPAAERTPLEHQLAELAYRQVDVESDRIETALKGADKDRAAALRKQLAQFDSLKPAPLPVALTVADVGSTASAVTIPKRGDEPIDPGYPTVLQEKPAAISSLPTAPHSTGRRAALAQWLTDTKNPLTARVIVNRIWQQHFGNGLAANASDFGRLGELPSHPELLDWLAAEFMKNRWSLKELHRLIVNSAAYRQSASHPDLEAGKLRDPENRLLWRSSVRRLDAEQIRDAFFAITAELDLKAGGPGATASAPRRSIYTKILRNTRDPLLAAFDAPQMINSVAIRDVTTTPVQSLLLLNNPMILARSRAFADRLVKLAPDDEERRIDGAYQLAFGRSPTSEEVATAQKFLDDQTARIDAAKPASGKEASASRRAAWADFCHVLLNASEFVYVE
jgi:Protein of unknown function (DUF1549)/Protein of unknown function (DUF1553)/Planctomycete cytochrome C